jgi:DNA-directed RNA polymerase III subunit RPC1
VQFQYGDDGLDPGCLEGDAQPVELTRSWSHARAIAANKDRGLLPYEITAITERELTSKKFAAVCSDQYISLIRKFVHDNLVKVLAAERKKHGIFEALQKEDEWDADTDLSMGASGTAFSASHDLEYG